MRIIGTVIFLFLLFLVLPVCRGDVLPVCRGDVLPEPVAEWKLDEGSGNVAKDSSGNGFDGRIMEALWINDEKLGKCLSFDGRKSYVVVNKADISKCISDRLTIEATIKPLSEVKGFVVSMPDAWAIYMQGFGGFVKLVDTKSWSGISNVDVKPEPGKISHLQGVWNAKDATWAIYIDGVWNPPSYGARCLEKINKSRYPLYIGAWKWEKGDKDDYYFKGIISNVRIYNRAFSPQEASICYSKAMASIEKKCRMSFSSPSFDISAGAVSPEILLERLSADGFIDTKCNGRVVLSSSSPSGVFSATADMRTPISELTMKNGRASFYYSDLTAGKPVISASMPDAIRSSQENRVSSFFGKFRHFVSGDSFDILLAKSFPEGASLKVNISDSSGKNILQHEKLIPGTKLDISELPQGDYVLTLEALKDGRVIERRKSLFAKIVPVEKSDKILEIKDGKCFYDGKPFLPLVLTVWTGWDFPETVGETDFKDIAEKGFDVVTLGWEFLKDEQEFQNAPWYKIRPSVRDIIRSTKMNMPDILDCCKADGLKVIFRPYYVWSGRDLSDEQLMAAGKIIRKYAGHSAVLCWQSYDETDGWTQSNLDAYRLYKEIDSSAKRPVYLNLAFSANAKDNITAADIISCDPYPIGHEQDDISVISKSLDEMRHLGTADKAIWHTVQFFGSPAEAWSRCPTPAELKSMAFLALNHGAKGLAFFNYYPEARRSIYSGRGINEELWRFSKVLNSQIKEMAHVYLSGKRLDGFAADKAGIDVAGFSYGNKTYIIAVNMNNKTVKTTINLNGTTVSSAKVRFEDRDIPVAKDINDVFSAYEVHIYEL